MTNPLLDEDSRWTLHSCPQCRPPISDLLKDVLADADLTLTVTAPFGGIADGGRGVTIAADPDPRPRAEVRVLSPRPEMSELPGRRG